MSYRIFKFDNGAISMGDAPDTIQFVPVSSIQREYNVYGCFYEDEDFAANIAEYKEERNEAFESYFEGDTPTLSEVKEWIEDFQDSFEYQDSKYWGRYGFPQRFVQVEDDELTVSESNISSFLDAEMDELVAHDDYLFEFYEYHDGSNFRRVNLTSGVFDTFCEDITDEFEGGEDLKENLELLNSYNGNDWRGTRLYFHEASQTYWVEEWTGWQGQEDSWEYFDTSEDNLKLEYELVRAFYDVNLDEIHLDNLESLLKFQGKDYELGGNAIQLNGEELTREEALDCFTQHQNF